MMQESRAIRRGLFVLVVSLLSFSALATETDTRNVLVRMTTNLGLVDIQINVAAAPTESAYMKGQIFEEPVKIISIRRVV